MSIEIAKLLARNSGVKWDASDGGGGRMLNDEGRAELIKLSSALVAKAARLLAEEQINFWTGGKWGKYTYQDGPNV